MIIAGNIKITSVILLTFTCNEINLLSSDVYILFVCSVENIYLERNNFNNDTCYMI